MLWWKLTNRWWRVAEVRYTRARTSGSVVRENGTRLSAASRPRTSASAPASSNPERSTQGTSSVRTGAMTWNSRSPRLV